MEKVLTNNKIIESIEEEDLSITLYSKAIILWQYKVLWGERKVGAPWKILKYWATSEVIDKLVVQNDHHLVFIGEDKKYKNVIEHMQKLGFITTVVCPNRAVQISKEANYQINWKLMSAKETNEDDIIAVKNVFPEVSPNYKQKYVSRILLLFILLIIIEF